jgi:D-arabinose 1-dehydrogenase-like Zn-dependent alcohol dehydrogenase
VVIYSFKQNKFKNFSKVVDYDEALAVWGVANENEIPTIPQFQKNWDNINIKGIIALVPPRLAPLLHKPCLHLQNSIF